MVHQHQIASHCQRAAKQIGEGMGAEDVAEGVGLHMNNEMPHFEVARHFEVAQHARVFEHKAYFLVGTVDWLEKLEDLNTNHHAHNPAALKH